MTEQEKQELLAEFEKRIDEKYRGCLSRENVQTVLKEPREKWFAQENSKMFNAFGRFICWQVWELIRKMTCIICGKQYGRHLSGIEYANEVAEKICQFIYDLKMEYGDQKSE